MSIYFSADHHFNHANIIKFCNRPFSSIEEMNEVLIQKWNAKVKPQDTVYYLGDFCFGSQEDYFKIRSRLNGHIYLIHGDHDKQIGSPEEFDLIGKIPLLNWKYNGISITMCHWCMRTWAKSHYNSWHLYAHSHGSLPSIGKSHDVGVDNNAFELLSFDDIYEIMKNKPDNLNLVKRSFIL